MFVFEKVNGFSYIKLWNFSTTTSLGTCAKCLSFFFLIVCLYKTEKMVEISALQKVKVHYQFTRGSYELIPK